MLTFCSSAGQTEQEEINDANSTAIANRMKILLWGKVASRELGSYQADKFYGAAFLRFCDAQHVNTRQEAGDANGLVPPVFLAVNKDARQKSDDQRSASHG